MKATQRATDRVVSTHRSWTSTAPRGGSPASSLCVALADRAAPIGNFVGK